MTNENNQSPNTDYPREVKTDVVEKVSPGEVFAFYYKGRSVEINENSGRLMFYSFDVMDPEKFFFVSGLKNVLGEVLRDLFNKVEPEQLRNELLQAKPAELQQIFLSLAVKPDDLRENLGRLISLYLDADKLVTMADKQSMYDYQLDLVRKRGYALFPGALERIPEPSREELRQAVNKTPDEFASMLNTMGIQGGNLIKAHNMIHDPEMCLPRGLSAAVFGVLGGSIGIYVINKNFILEFYQALSKFIAITPWNFSLEKLVFEARKTSCPDWGSMEMSQSRVLIPASKDEKKAFHEAILSCMQLQNVEGNRVREAIEKRIAKLQGWHSEPIRVPAVRVRPPKEGQHKRSGSL